MAFLNESDVTHPSCDGGLTGGMISHQGHGAVGSFAERLTSGSVLLLTQRPVADSVRLWLAQTWLLRPGVACSPTLSKFQL